VITIAVQVFSPAEQRERTFEALIDTGANTCAIAEHIAQDLGLAISLDPVHLWQVRDPLTLRQTQLDVRYNGQPYLVEAVVIDIPEALRRNALPQEYCTRPNHAHPLTTRIVLGENFFNQLSEEDRRSIGLL